MLLPSLELPCTPPIDCISHYAKLVDQILKAASVECMILGRDINLPN